MNSKYPTKDQCISLLKSLKCPPWIIDHSIQVAHKALNMAKNFEVDLKLIRVGALLHDIGRSKSNGLDHAIIGARILKEMGFPQEVVKIVERHIGAGIIPEEAVKLGLPEKDYRPLTLEEKIVAHADNLLHGSQEVEIDEVITKWESQLGRKHPSIDRLKNLHEELIISPRTSNSY